MQHSPPAATALYVGCHGKLSALQHSQLQVKLLALNMACKRLEVRKHMRERAPAGATRALTP
jgi:hypothetical protein